MPINKFGSHFLDKADIFSNQPSLSNSFYICEPSTFHSKCFLRLNGKKIVKLNNKLYVLENQGTAFVFPVSGKIENVKHYSADGDVLINSKIYKFNQLVGFTIKSGDKIEFKIGKPELICIDFVIQCPIEKNV